MLNSKTDYLLTNAINLGGISMSFLSDINVMLTTITLLFAVGWNIRKAIIWWNEREQNKAS